MIRLDDHWTVVSALGNRLAMGAGMDTLRSPIPQGSMGGPTGTGRPSRLFPKPGSFLNGNELEASGSRIFSDEVERAEERAKLGSVDERLAAQAQERRSTRHDGFGQDAPRDAARVKPDRGAQSAGLAGAAQQQASVAQDPAPSTKPATDSTTKETGSSLEETSARVAPEETSSAHEQSQVSQANSTGTQDQTNLTQTTAATVAGQAAQQAAPAATANATAPSTEAPGVRAIASDTTKESPKTEPTAPAPQSRAEEISEAAEILRQIKVAATSGSRRISVELSPFALGRVQIRVGLRHQGVDAVVEADKPSTYAALERQMPELRALLSEVTGGRDVTLTLLGGEGQEQRTQQDGSRREYTSPSPSSSNISTKSAPAPRAQQAAPPSSTAAIDTYA